MSTSHTSTLQQQYSSHFGSDGPASSPLGEDRFADAVISNSGVPENTLQASKNSEFELNGVSPRLHKRIPNFPVPRVISKRRSFQETVSWEGVVTQVNEGGIIAKLNRRYQDFPAEEAVIPWPEIDPADRDIALEGAPFSWKVGYLKINGQRLSVSHIEFRRIPNFSVREQLKAKVKAAEYADLFDD
jgi:hypothetical protein